MRKGEKIKINTLRVGHIKESEYSIRAGGYEFTM